MEESEPRWAGIVAVPPAWRNLTLITVSLLIVSTGASHYPGSVGGAGDFRIRGQVLPLTSGSRPVALQTLMSQTLWYLWEVSAKWGN